MEYGTAEYNLRLREVQALEKIAESLKLISISMASNNVHNLLKDFPRDIHITGEGSDENGSKA